MVIPDPTKRMNNFKNWYMIMITEPQQKALRIKKDTR